MCNINCWLNCCYSLGHRNIVSQGYLLIHVEEVVFIHKKKNVYTHVFWLVDLDKSKHTFAGNCGFVFEWNLAKCRTMNVVNKIKPSKISLYIFASISISLALTESIRPRTNTSLVLSVKFPVVHFPPWAGEAQVFLVTLQETLVNRQIYAMVSQIRLYFFKQRSHSGF